jgi:uroporphyrinogen decarboxylase
MTSESRFLRACHREAVDATPIWLMRQAGRYLPEYRKLRGHHPLLTLIKTPELACEVTLQPIEAFDLDAAIIFSDILPPLDGMGLHLRFAEGEGPVIGNPVQTVHDIAKLRVLPPEETLHFTLDAIRLARTQLDGRNIPLIGFSGAPFTLAAYAIEGRGSRNYTLAKGLMMTEPAAWDELMSKLSEVVGTYLLAQAQAGAQALQLFDSWAGQLSASDYRQFALPYTQRAVAIARQAGVPIIHFATETSGYLEAMRATGADVVSLDWRVDLGAAWRRLGKKVALQGNLDPVALLGPWEALKQRAQAILDQAGGRAGHIFNLGHGILPETPPDSVRRLVDFVHQRTATTDGQS